MKCSDNNNIIIKALTDEKVILFAFFLLLSSIITTFSINHSNILLPDFCYIVYEVYDTIVDILTQKFKVMSFS